MIQKETLQQTFQGSGDVKFQTYYFNQQPVLFIFCEAMINDQMLQEVIIPRLTALDMNSIPEDLLQQLHLPGLQKHTSIEPVIPLVYKGNLLLYVEHLSLLLSVNIANKPNRQPEETRTEVAVKGPRDNFIEDLAVNIALIRKRLPTPSLYVEKLTIGQRSDTEVAILYLEDVANLDILEELKNQLKKVDMDIVFSGDLLMEQINKKSYLFPLMDYTGRPDYAVQILARGRFIILVDGVAYANVTPINFSMLLKTGEDDDYPVLYGSLERLLRLASVMIGILLPAFWLALTTFHQNQLPLQLLATVVQSNIGLPLPSALEMIIMIFLFELFREAGLRLPTPIGTTIGVVGGLIIGDAAIRAGITSPAMIVIIATSVIASYTAVNQSLVTAVGILRLLFIVMTAFFGLFGFFLSLFALLTYLANIRIFGVPYLNLPANINMSTITKTLFRLPGEQYNTRPGPLKTKDKTRRGSSS